jgi:hypothetical protein
MSIERKIAEMLAQSKLNEGVTVAGKEGGMDPGTHGAQAGDKSGTPGNTPTTVKPEAAAQNPDNARNNVEDEKEAEAAPEGKANPKNGDQTPITNASVKGVKEDIDALMNGEELSEDFRAKATTIYEAAVMTRVNAEVARIEEEFNTKLQEATEQVKEGLVEQVDGYLDYVVEQWIAQNEIALEHGMKSEILEGFVSGLKGLFEEHYIDIPEEKFDVLGSLEEQVEQLEAKLNEQVAANVELNKTVGSMKRSEIVTEAAEGLTDTEVEKFTGLAEELSYEDEQSFKTKVQTIRENYFTTKAQADVKSVVTDTPVDTLVEEKKLNPAMNAYVSMLNRK